MLSCNIHGYPINISVKDTHTHNIHSHPNLLKNILSCPLMFCHTNILTYPFISTVKDTHTHNIHSHPNLLKNILSCPLMFCHNNILTYPFISRDVDFLIYMPCISWHILWPALTHAAHSLPTCTAAPPPAWLHCPVNIPSYPCLSFHICWAFRAFFLQKSLCWIQYFVHGNWQVWPLHHNSRCWGWLFVGT